MDMYFMTALYCNYLEMIKSISDRPTLSRF